MKKLLLSALFFLANTGSAQEATTAATDLEQTVVKAVVASDSDGDLIPDGLDPNPLLPDIPAFSWWVSDVTVGWDLDQSQIDKFSANSGTESVEQRKTSFTVGGGISAGGGLSQGFNADPGAIFLSLLPGGNLLKKAGDDFQAQSHLAVSFDLKKSFDRLETVKEIRSEFQKLEKQRAIKNRHIEFTVEFFNETDDVFHFTNYSIPVQTSARQTRAEALCFVAGKMTQEFEVPANRPAGYPVRFRAMLSTTQSEQILDALESGDLRLAINRSSGKAVNQTTQIDEIAQRQRISRDVDNKTAELQFRTDGNSTSWRVAKTNPNTGQPTTLQEAIDSVNRMVATPQDDSYIETSGGVLYAVGSFRNTPQNAFEVTNAKKAKLKVLGWTRMNRYGAVNNGKWAHQLDQPVGEGAIFSFQPYQTDRKELAKQIHESDPQLTSEWLSLCHFWLHYDPEKPFVEYPLSITEYPLVPFFQNLTANFALANFESMTSEWIARQNGIKGGGPDEDASIVGDDFNSRVRIHRKDILDAAFDGYTEAGALLTRIPKSDRDDIETKAIETALQIGNTDAAAVEISHKLFRDLKQGVDVDLDKLRIPDHVFAKNLYGFVRFGGCNKGLKPGKSRDAALKSFSDSSDLDSRFGHCMKGWLLLNRASQKRRKLINGPNWDTDRDEGVALLKKAVEEDSILAKYILANTYHGNRISVARNKELAEAYLKAAAEERFGDAAHLYAARYGR